MRNTDIQDRMDWLNGMIQESEATLAHKCNRRAEISKKPESAIKRKIIARYKTEIMQLTDEINNYKTELWGLQEMEVPNAQYVW